MKRGICAVLLLSALLVGGALLVSFWSHPSTSSTPSPTTSQPRETVGLLQLEEPRIETILEDDPSLPYVIDVTYPQFHESQTGPEMMNTMIESWVQDRIAFFLSDGNATSTPTDIDEPFGKSFFRLRFELLPSPPGLVQISFLETPYFALSAHPGAHRELFVLKTHDSTRYTSSDLLQTAPENRGKIVELIIQELEKQYVENNETKPQKEQRIEWRDALASKTALETFSVRKDGVVWSFDPYVVGSYAEGIKEVFLPWSLLESYLADTEFTRSVRNWREVP